MPYSWDRLKDGDRAKFVFLKLDIVGHSKIVENNPKDKASNTLNNFENWVEGHVSKSGGRLWTWQGDGGLAAFFASYGANEAVSCALNILNELGDFNKFKSEIKAQIKVRIALHLGDVTYREQTGRIHSTDINFVSHVEEEYSSSNDICISRSMYTELSETAREKFRGIGSFQGVQLYSKEGKIRDKVVVHTDHRDLPGRKEWLTQHFRKQLRIFSTTADNYFVDTEVLAIIKDKLRNGCKVRALLLNPDSPFMKDREHQEKIYLVQRQKISIETIKSLKNDFPQYIELRFFDCSPTYQALVIDDYRIFVAINVYGIAGTTDFPCVEIINGPDTNVLFEKFILAFETLWNESKLGV